MCIRDSPLTIVIADTIIRCIPILANGIIHVAFLMFRQGFGCSRESSSSEEHNLTIMRSYDTPPTRRGTEWVAGFFRLSVELSLASPTGLKRNPHVFGGRVRRGTAVAPQISENRHHEIARSFIYPTIDFETCCKLSKARYTIKWACN